MAHVVFPNQGKILIKKNIYIQININKIKLLDLFLKLQIAGNNLCVSVYLKKKNKAMESNAEFF